MRSIQSESHGAVKYVPPFFVILFSIFISTAGFAGIRADVKFTLMGKDGKKQVTKGTYVTDGTRVFVETGDAGKHGTKAGKKAETKQERDRRNSFIYDRESKKATYLLHHHKKYMPIDMRESRSWESNFWARFMKEGAMALKPEEFKARGYELTALNEEKIDGKKLKHWRAQKSLGGQVEVIDLYTEPKWDDVAVKIVAKVGMDVKQEFALINLRREDVKPEIFTTPAGYEIYSPKIMSGPLPADLQQKLDGKNQAPGAPRPQTAKK